MHISQRALRLVAFLAPHTAELAQHCSIETMAFQDPACAYPQWPMPHSICPVCRSQHEADRDRVPGLTLGHCLQIAVFVMPVMVLAGWAIGKDFTLTYIDPFASMFLTLSVVHAYFVSSDGHSNWLMGVQLISTYTLIAMLYLLLAY